MNNELIQELNKELLAIKVRHVFTITLLETYEGMTFEGKEIDIAAERIRQLKSDIRINKEYIKKIEDKIKELSHSIT